MSEEYRVIYGHQLLNFKDNDHYHAALKASHVLITRRQIEKVLKSSQGETITVHGISVTQVYIVRTFVNDNWFSDPENSAEFSIAHEMTPETPESSVCTIEH